MMPQITRRAEGHTPTFPEPFLDCLYPLPRPLVTMEDFRRFHHKDLTDFADEELAREYRRVQSRADLDPDPASSAWLASRLAAIAEVRASRRPRASSAPERPARPVAPERGSVRVGGTVIEVPRGGRRHGRG